MQNELRFLSGLVGDGQKRRLLAGAVVIGLESAFALVIPWTIGSIAGALVGRHGGEPLSLARSFGILIACLSAQAGCSLLHHRITARVYSEVVFALRLSVYEQLQSLPYERRAALASGDAATLIGRDADAAAQFASGFLAALLPTALTCATTVALLVHISPIYGAVMAVAVPAHLVAFRLMGRRLAGLSRELAAARADAGTTADDQLRYWQIARAFSAEAFVSARFRSKEERAQMLERRLHLAVAALHPLTQVSAAVGVVVVAWSMSSGTADGTLSPEAFVRFLLYALALSRSLGSLAGLYGALQKARGSGARLVQVLGYAPERQGGTRVSRMEHTLTLSKVTFAYEGGAPVLDGLDLTIRRGDLLIVTGANGAGKSTLVRLLLGFLEPASGQIAIDGVPLTSSSLASLRRQIAWVPQETVLLRGTLGENILLGGDTRDEELDRALDGAGARSLVSRLPGGLEARLGEGGLNLSGGERQRVALARALLADSPILLLDEATSMIDLATESEIVERLEALHGQRTVVFVSHRVPPITVPHRVIELRNGRAVEIGSVSVVA